MRKIVILTFFISFFLSNYSQIKFANQAEKIEPKSTIQYDSLSNKPTIFSLNLLIGQKVLITPQNSFGYTGYTDFYEIIDMSGKGKNITYSPISKGSDQTKIESLLGKYFNIVDFVDINSLEQFLVLENENLKIYFKIRKFNFKTADPDFWYFIVVGYYEKMKQKLLDKKFVFQDQFINDKDYITTANIKNRFGQTWKCEDVIVDSKTYEISAIFCNNLGEKVAIAPNNIFDKKGNTKVGVFSPAYAEKYKKQYGLKIWNTILEGRVEIGMTKNACLLAIGKPNKVNSTETSKTLSEQWIYSSENEYIETEYYYFKNGILTAIQ
jgi:hypothetical protein